MTALCFQTKRPKSLDTARGMSLYEEVGRTAGEQGYGRDRPAVAQAEVYQAGAEVGLERLRPSPGTCECSEPWGTATSVLEQPSGGRDPGHIEAEVGFVCGPRS